MMSNPYLTYKPSGIDWLRDVTVRNRPDLPLLSVVREQGVTIRDIDDRNENHNFIPDDLSSYKVVNAGQFATNKMKAWQGSFGVSEYNGIVSPAYFVFDVRNVHQGFFHRAIRSKAYVPFFSQASDGVRIAQWDLSKVRMREIPFFTPPLDEQTAIVRYLDHADERIQRAISAKERLIELLTEQRQAVINQAVTRGLDPNVRLKDSRVEWLGEVPEHWTPTTVKRHFEVQLGKMLQPMPRSPDDVEVPYLKAQHVHWNHIRIEDPPSMWANPNEVKQFGIRKGDLLIVEGGAGATNSALLEDTPQGYIIQNALHRVRPRAQARNDFLLFIMMAVASIGWFEAISNKATIPHFTKEKLDSLPIPFPSVSEQTAIVHYLDKATDDIDAAINNAQRQIDLLHEYRMRLIADVVTGKVDVRDVVNIRIDNDATKMQNRNYQSRPPWNGS